MTGWKEAGCNVEALMGTELNAVIPDVARLRITVFRDFPYLYDGDPDYETRYLDTFAKAEGAVVVVARDGNRVIGAATGAPLSAVEGDWSAPFITAGQDISSIFYCAESVLLPGYRGMGIGHAFFDEREAHARSLGMSRACFCSVVRPPDHPALPQPYRPNDAFWNKRGYAPLAGLTARFAWKDIGGDDETTKTLQFWGRAL